MGSKRKAKFGGLDYFDYFCSRLTTLAIKLCKKSLLKH